MSLHIIFVFYTQCLNDDRSVNNIIEVSIKNNTVNLTTQLMKKKKHYSTQSNIFSLKFN